MSILPPQFTSRDMTAMLRRHYLPENRPAGGVFAPEIQSPCGARRADLIWLSTTGTGQRHMVGHEIKVSRSDVMVELRDPTKADPWMQFCNEWWLVISDPSLISGLEIPEPWGIMAPPSGRRTRSMTVVRPAPRLTPSLASDGVARVTAWLNTKYVDLQNSHDREIDWRDRSIAGLQSQLSELRDGAPRDLSPAAKRVQDIYRAAEKILRNEHSFLRMHDADVVAAIVDTAKARRAAQDVTRAIASIARATDEIAARAKALPCMDLDETLPLGEVS